MPTPAVNLIFSALGPLVFGSPWMWLWGAAAAAPILIHLWNRRRFREMRWAAMQYLLAAMRKNSRRIRIEQLLLLAVRTMILLLAAAAWADLSLAWLGSAGMNLVSGVRTHTLLVIDGSYSMGVEQNGVTRFDQARQLAAELVDAGNQGDGYTLLLMGESPRLIIGEPAFAAGDVKEELNSLRLSHAGANLSATLAEVDRLLAQVRDKNKRLTQHKVCLLTDLGRTTWEAATEADVRRQLDKLAHDAELVLLDVGNDDRENLAVTNLEQLQSFVTVARPVDFQATVKNFGQQDQTGQMVELVIDGQRVAEQMVDVSAGEEASVAFTHHFETAGEHEARIDLATDRLMIDNHRWLSVPVRESIAVLCVSGKPGSARYIAYALSPTRPAQPQIRTELVTESALLERDLQDYDCIFLANVGRFNRDEAGVLASYLESGGGLVFFLGDQVIPQSYNQELGGGDGWPQVLPAKLEAAVAEAQYRFDPRDYEHPIVSPFRGQERAGLLTTPIWKYFRLQVPADSPAKVALWFEGGDPAIVEERIGRGRSILVATAASDESLDRSTTPPTPWTAISSWHSFPPLVQEMLAVAVRGRYQGRNLLVGEPLSDTVNSSVANLTLDIHIPDRPRQRLRASLQGEDNHWSFAGDQVSGIYRVEFDPPVVEPREFAVNVDVRESDLARVALDDLPAALTHDAPDVSESGKMLGLTTSSSLLFRYLLMAVLGLLLVESVLAWHFGNRAA